MGKAKSDATLILYLVDEDGEFYFKSESLEEIVSFIKFMWPVVDEEDVRVSPTDYDRPHLYVGSMTDKEDQHYCSCLCTGCLNSIEEWLSSQREEV